MFGFKVGQCRTCKKYFVWYPWDSKLLKFFDVCSDECLAGCEEAQQCLHTDPPSALPSAVESQNTAGG